jgi:hypothetical protein
VDRHDHRGAPRRPLRVVLAGLKGATLGGLLTLVVVGGMHAANPSAHQGATTENDAYQQVIARAVTDHECSYSGFGTEKIPASALIRNSKGEVRQVTFDVGWDVYNGKRPGTLIAVCLDDTRGNELVQVSNQADN